MIVYAHTYIGISKEEKEEDLEKSNPPKMFGDVVMIVFIASQGKTFFFVVA